MPGFLPDAFESDSKPANTRSPCSSPVPPVDRSKSGRSERRLRRSVDLPPGPRESRVLKILLISCRFFPSIKSLVLESLRKLHRCKRRQFQNTDLLGGVVSGFGARFQQEW